MSLTEYALIFSVLAVGTLAATQFLGDQAAEESTQQASCVSERPPPPGCQIPTAATTTTSIPGPPPTTTPTVTQVTIAPPTPGNVTIGLPTVTGTSPGPWALSFPVTSVVDSTPAPVAGAVVRFAIYWSDGTTTVFSGSYTSCTTDATGSCTANFTQPPETGLTRIEAVITSVEGIDPEPVYPTTPFVVTLP